jgi:hypothetical protein
MKTEVASAPATGSKNYKNSNTASLVKQLREGKVNDSEKSTVLNILASRKQSIAEFIPVRRGRKPIEGRDGDEKYPRGVRVKFDKYRKPGETMTGEVVANSTPYTNKKGETNYLLTIRVPVLDAKGNETGKFTNTSKNSKAVELV